jgi:hypothetical protein
VLRERPLLRSRSQSHRVNLDVDAAITERGDDVTDGSVQEVRADEPEVCLDGLGEERLAAEEDVGAPGVAVDLDVGHLLEASEELAIRVVDPDEEVGDALELTRHLGDEIIGEIRVVVVRQQLPIGHFAGDSGKGERIATHCPQRGILLARQNNGLVVPHAEIDIANVLAAVPLGICRDDGEPLFDRLAAAGRVQWEGDGTKESLG